MSCAGPKSNHCGMTMIALVLKILLITIMMTMTIVVMGKMIPIKMIRITQEKRQK